MKQGNRPPPAAATKRPRGRPRKVKRNTADTAIVLSDSESEISPQSNSNRKRRASSEVDADELPRTAKRQTTSGRVHIGDASFVLSEFDQLYQQLARERKLRAETEQKKAELQAEIDQKEASWAADLAAHTIPLQAELQKLAKEKMDLLAEYEKVKARPRASSDRDNDSGVDVNMPQRYFIDTANSGTYIQDRALGEVRERLADAEKRILNLQRDLDASSSMRSKLEKDLAASDEKQKATEDKLCEMADRLEAEERARMAAEDRLRMAREEITTVERKLKEVENKASQQLSIVANKRKEAEDKLAMKEQQLEETGKMLHRSEETIKRLERQQAAMVAETRARLKGMATLENKVATLERKNLQLSQDTSKQSSYHQRELVRFVGENDASKRQLDAREGLLSQLQHESRWIRSPTRANQGAGTSAMKTTAWKGIILTTPLDDIGQYGSNKGPKNTTKATEELRCSDRQNAKRVHDSTCTESEYRHKITQLSRILEARDKEILYLRQSLVRQTLGEDSPDEDSRQLRRRLLQAEEQLREKHNLVASQNLETSEIRDTIRYLHAERKRLEAELASHRQQLQQYGVQLSRKAEVIMAKHRQIKQLHDTISSLEREKTQLRDELNIQKRKPQQLGDETAKQNNESEVLNNNTATKTGEEIVASTQQKPNEAIHEKEDALQHKAAPGASELDRLKVRLAEATATIERLTEAAAEREAAIAGLQADIRTVTAREKATHEAILALEMENADLQARLKASASQTAELREEMAGLTASNAELWREGELRIAELERLRTKLAGLEVEGKRLEEYLVKRDRCLERMRELLRAIPVGVGSGVGNGIREGSDHLGT
ncbi:hypothetical protein VTH82DRAFT_6797 [Thermothelomyces myriococcoides]